MSFGALPDLLLARDLGCFTSFVAAVAFAFPAAFAAALLSFLLVFAVLNSRF
jgi:hypothetical protein